MLLHDRHHRVSSTIKIHHNTHNSFTINMKSYENHCTNKCFIYGVFVKQYLHTILDMAKLNPSLLANSSFSGQIHHFCCTPMFSSLARMSTCGEILSNPSLLPNSSLSSNSPLSLYPCTVNSRYSGHPRDRDLVSVIAGCENFFYFKPYLQ